MKTSESGCQHSSTEKADTVCASAEKSCAKRDAFGKCKCTKAKNLEKIDVEKAISDYNDSLFGNLRL